MKYVLYHSSITNDSSALEKLRKHAENGEIVEEFYDDLSSSDSRPEQQKAIKKCRDSGATLLIFDLSTIENMEKEAINDLQVKRLN
ncbi:hypothetical protein GCM10007103_08160 [Salinimicrobium marinum]|uniref:Resolvase, N terminal domain n=1 Tax=Salinimicrobium marinum TaxID=680283 RepID=A0A918VVT0_9FLAO|nr:hypothetical protein [Salinimicrobium marinum]GHA29314.1 hypothetical protein GCM10007103_08160 [Salinimicrobium marinum]